MSHVLNVSFRADPPPAGNTFNFMRVKAIDAGGTAREQNFTLAQIMAAAGEPNELGVYTMAVTFPTIAVGAYTYVVQSVNTSGVVYGPTVNGAGVVTLAEGAWFPAPVAA